jgi:hypothetical protein
MLAMLKSYLMYRGDDEVPRLGWLVRRCLVFLDALRQLSDMDNILREESKFAALEKETTCGLSS